jgi:lysophospholipase L1-like esterase
MKRKAISLAKNISLAISSLILFILLLEGGAYLINQSHSKGYYEPDVRNSLGLRDPREPAEIHGRDVILVLGDSFTYGTGVSYQDSYPASLEKKLKELYVDNDYIVINAGDPGLDTQLTYKRLLETFGEYKPKHVIIGFTPGDIIQNRIAYDQAQTESSIEKSGPAIEHPGRDQTTQDIIYERERDFPLLVMIRSYLTINSNIARVLAFYYKNYLIKYIKPPESLLNMSVGSDNEQEFEITAKFLDEIHSYLSERGAQMILLNVIPLFRFDEHPYSHINKALKEYAETRNIHFINPLDVFSRYNSADLWVSMGDGHYNAKANSIMAGVIKDYLVENDLIAHR